MILLKKIVSLAEKKQTRSKKKKTLMHEKWMNEMKNSMILLHIDTYICFGMNAQGILSNIQINIWVDGLFTNVGQMSSYSIEIKKGKLLFFRRALKFWFLNCNGKRSET